MALQYLYCQLSGSGCHEEMHSNKKVEGWCRNLDHGLWISHSRFQIPFSVSVERGSQIDEMIEVSLESSHAIRASLLTSISDH
jgi:hypothetical protein